MTTTRNDQRHLAELHMPARNRYFYGKLLDAEHLTLEQDYSRGLALQTDRLVLGAGVVCGLHVTAVQEGAALGFTISPGVALDGWGRRIVVPAEHTVVPATLTGPHAGALLTDATLKLCYCECDTDFAPALAPDPGCDCGPSCEAGTTQESFRLEVLAGLTTAASRPCPQTILGHLRDGDVEGALAELAATACPAVPEDPCIVLANLRVARNRLTGNTLTVDRTPREIVPTNAVLLQLLTCLAARVEECCAHGGTPTPTPLPLAISSVQIFNTAAANPQPLLATVASPTDHPSVSVADVPGAIDVEFVNAKVDPASVVSGQSVNVTRTTQAGTVALQMRVQSSPRKENTISLSTDFVLGDYTVEIRGDPPSPVVSLPDGARPAHALDGGPGGWPSADHVSGGNCVFAFSVA